MSRVLAIKSLIYLKLTPIKISNVYYKNLKSMLYSMKLLCKSNLKLEKSYSALKSFVNFDPGNSQ